MSVNMNAIMLTDGITIEMLQKKKIMMLLPEDNGYFDPKRLLDIFVASHKLGITWNVVEKELKPNYTIYILRKTYE